jgi:hypothetical protein
MQSSYREEPVEVLAGWDHMQSQVFVTVALLDDRGEWRDGPPLLEAWKDVAERPTEIEPAAVLAAGIRDKLIPLGIAVPDKMLGEIAAHIVLDVGNVIVQYTPEGVRTLLEGEFADIDGQ